jgi:nicotinate-nucleotide adenylyltransferase
VSPQNPLKAADGMAPLDDRIGTARAIARDRRIVVTDVEARLGARFTVDTVAALIECFPEKRFVWIMGADNLLQFPRWKNWQKLFAMVPIAVFDRAPYSIEALAGKAAHVFASYRHVNRDARRLAEQKPPAWTFFHTPLHPASATAIRDGRDPPS